MRPALLDFGPNAWIRQGFVPMSAKGDALPRTGTSSQFRLLSRSGEGIASAAAPSHFVEPARVTLKVEGRTVAAFDVQADTKTPYRIVDVPLPRQEGRHPFVLSIEAPSDNPRPLGLALDWMELESAGGDARLVPPRSMLFAAPGSVAYAAPRVAGAGPVLALGPAALWSRE